jgi:hypothetical protein
MTRGLNLVVLIVLSMILFTIIDPLELNEANAIPLGPVIAAAETAFGLLGSIAAAPEQVSTIVEAAGIIQENSEPESTSSPPTQPESTSSPPTQPESTSSPPTQP